ncbi:MAG: phosphoribosylformylglycinamidine synthase subunit PurQ [Geminicoccaceae bacterium]
MRTGVITFPGSNCDRDLAVAFERITGKPCRRIWHRETEIGDVDVIGVPGGFSYGDYLRCGAIAARSPILKAVAQAAKSGRKVIGICNGWQILLEAGLLPGALIRNRGLRFVCRPIDLTVVNNETAFTRRFDKDAAITLPVAHHDGQYVADSSVLDELDGEGRIVFRYRENPNGSAFDIAGIVNREGNVLGMMPHPERAADRRLGGTDGIRLFRSILEQAA